MAVWTVVTKSTAEETSRLDAEYYQSKYISALVYLSKYPAAKMIREVGRVLRGKNPKKYTDTGIPVIRAIDLRDLTNTEGFRYASPEEDLFYLKSGDVLISSIGEGSIGKVQVYNGNQQCATVSEVSVVRASKYNPYALGVFLQTRFGYSQLERRITGSTGQLHLYPRDIGTVLIPLLPESFQKEIEGLAARSTQELRNSKLLYLQAEQMLLTELGLDKLDLSQPNYCIVTLSQAKDVNRMDAEHFQPKYERLIQHLANTGKVDLLGNLVTQPIRRGLQPIYVEEGKVIVVNSQHLGRYLLNIEATERTDDTFWKSNKHCQVKKKDVLLYSTGAYVGRTNAWLEDQRAIASNHVTIIRPDATCNPLYLSVYLNATPGLMQAERWASGSGQREIYPEDIAHFVVYLPSTQFQQRIADLVTQSWQARQKAMKLLEEAKRKVEDMIEGAASN